MGNTIDLHALSSRNYQLCEQLLKWVQVSLSARVERPAGGKPPKRTLNLSQCRRLIAITSFRFRLGQNATCRCFTTTSASCQKPDLEVSQVGFPDFNFRFERAKERHRSTANRRKLFGHLLTVVKAE
jgi:hypothetical protein